MRLQQIHERFEDKADFWLVYMREAHPREGPRPNERVDIEQPLTLERRREVAGQCVEALELDLPVLVDDMENTVARAYNAMPDRLFIVKADGTIGYRGARGPRGFDPDEMEQALERLLAP